MAEGEGFEIRVKSMQLVINRSYGRLRYPRLYPHRFGLDSAPLLIKTHLTASAKLQDIDYRSGTARDRTTRRPLRPSRSIRCRAICINRNSGRGDHLYLSGQGRKAVCCACRSSWFQSPFSIKFIGTCCAWTRSATNVGKVYGAAAMALAWTGSVPVAEDTTPSR